MSPTAVQGTAVKLCRCNRAEEGGRLYCPVSKDVPEQYKKSVMGYPQCWVQLCPLKAPNTPGESGPQIRAAPLLAVPGWVRSQLGCSRWTKRHFHRHLQKQSVYCSLFCRRLSRCCCCALITKKTLRTAGGAVGFAGRRRAGAAMLRFLIRLRFKPRWFAAGSSGQCCDEGVGGCPAPRGAADHCLKQQMMSGVLLQLCIRVVC